MAHDRISTSVSLGRNGAFFAASNQGHRWQKIPEAACDYYQKFTTPAKFTTSRVNTIDLGYGDSFLGIGVDNTWFWDLGKEYPALEKMIKQKGITNCVRNLLTLFHLPGSETYHAYTKVHIAMGHH